MNGEQYSSYQPGVYNPREQNISAVKELINSDEIIDNVKFQLTGKKHVRTTDENNKPIVIVVPYHEPLMNDTGVNKITSELKSYVQDNLILSWYNIEEINKRSENYFTKISFDLAKNIVTYGIYTREKHGTIREILSRNYEAVLRRSFKGLTLINALQNINVNENRNFDNTSDKENRGIFRGQR